MYIKEIPKWKPLHERLVEERINGKDEEQKNITQNRFI